MPDFLQAIQNGSTNLWFFIPTAILLGALHGLEPGHSKTMMASFIIAIRGTVNQAILLGLSAAFSHTIIIWILAALALNFGSQWDAETVEPYIQLGSAVIIVAMATWMFLRVRKDLKAATAVKEQNHSHSHSELFVLDTEIGTGYASNKGSDTNPLIEGIVPQLRGGDDSSINFNTSAAINLNEV